MELGDMAVLAAVVAWLGFVAVEFLKPARTFEKVSWWKAKGVAFFVLSFALNGVLPTVLEPWLKHVKLFPGDKLGTVGGAVLGLLAGDLLNYWLHRAYHRVGFLWRWVHQMHHSAERVDIWGAGFVHPLEIAGGAIINFFAFNVVMGLSADAAGLAGGIFLFAVFLQHANLKTPTWLGYILSRPEQHGVHHERGVHALNYANFPLFDLLFGTFRNPREWSEQGGFYTGASKRMVDMLIGRDISNAQVARTKVQERAYPVRTESTNHRVVV